MRRMFLPICSLLLVLAGCGSIDNAGEVAPVLTVTAAAPATVVVGASPQKEGVMTNTASTTPEEEQPTAPPDSTSPPAPATPTAPSTPTPLLRRATQMPIQAAPPTIAAPTNTQVGFLDPQLDAVVQGARADLAQRQGVAVDAVEVSEVRSVTWPDSALGCPQPGVAYKQVTVDGLLIRLRIGEQIFNYHSGGSKPPFLCQQPLKPIATPGSGGGDQ